METNNAYFRAEDQAYLLKRKTRLEARLVEAEARMERHKGLVGYGNEIWYDLAERRALEIKQAIFEVNLELES